MKVAVPFRFSRSRAARSSYSRESARCDVQVHHLLLRCVDGAGPHTTMFRSANFRTGAVWAGASTGGQSLSAPRGERERAFVFLLVVVSTSGVHFLSGSSGF